MKKFLPLLFLLFFAVSCQKKEETSGKPLVLTSIPPNKYFVERIAGETVEVMSIVPPGVDSHTYEPSPKQVERMADAAIWFQMGDPFEKKIEKALIRKNFEIVIRNLNQDIQLMSYKQDTAGDHKEVKDIHTWLSPSLAANQCNVIAETLASEFYENTSLYRKNYHAFVNELIDLDSEIKTILKNIPSRAFLTSHPSFGYYSRDYELFQISIELEGRDPLPKEIETLYALAKKHDVKVVLIEPEFSSRGARILAKKLQIPVRMVDPYSEKYKETLLRIAKILRNPENPS